MKNSLDAFGNFKSQRGLTLVEILVTAVVMSVGLLGIAALHLASLKNSVDSNTRSKAIWMVHDIEDRMRANRANANSYVILMGAIPVGTSVAALDLIAWKNELTSASSGLPNGDGSIIALPLPSGGTLYTITVKWAEHSGTPTQFVSQTEI